MQISNRFRPFTRESANFLPGASRVLFAQSVAVRRVLQHLTGPVEIQARASREQAAWITISEATEEVRAHRRAIEKHLIDEFVIKTREGAAVETE